MLYSIHGIAGDGVALAERTESSSKLQSDRSDQFIQSSSDRLVEFVELIIAEGFGKRSAADKARFLNIAEGSLEECRYYLILSQDLGYGQNESLTSALEETSKLLNAYVRAILASGS
jgi:four helix bundle protein